jgi:hypothetical protein
MGVKLKFLNNQLSKKIQARKKPLLIFKRILYILNFLKNLLRTQN